MGRKRKKAKDKKVLFNSKGENLKKTRRKRKISRAKERFSFRKLSMWLLILLIVIGTVYGINMILRRGVQEIVQETNTVLGLEDIPTFPESSFLYAEDITNQSVKDMLSEGKSAYVINDRSDFKDVRNYYANELNSKGWNLVLDVEIGAEDKRYGQYWIKDDKGLRIHSKFNDIWYEYITPKEAESGLSNRVSEEIEIDMLLAGSDFQQLLPDYPWEIKIPKDYLVRYEVSDFEELRSVSFQRISTGQYITVYPIGYWGAKALDYQLEDYAETVSKGTEDWSIYNTTVTSFQGNRSLSGTLVSSNSEIKVLMLKNNRNMVTYVLSAEDSSDPLYKYIVENIMYLGQEDNS